MEQRPLTEMQLRTLTSSLNPNRVSSRKQGGAQLSFVEAWDIKATLIRVFGYGGFDAEVIQSAIIHKEEVERNGNNGPYKQWKVSAQATVRLHIKQLDATYTETAIGDGNMGDVTEALDKAIKTAESDALKRAAIYLGTQFGLSLYDNGSTRDVIRTIVAPDQLTINGVRVDEAGQPLNQPKPQQEQGQEQGQPANAYQEAVADATGNDVSTDEQHERNKEMLRDKLNAEVVKQEQASQ